MIQPDEIRRKAARLYGDFLRAWIDGDRSFFPRVVPAQRELDSDWARAIESVRALRAGSKEVLGYGYSVEWREVNSRRFGRNQFPDRITIETQDDFLRFIGRAREFEQLAEAVGAIRGRHVALEGWIRSNPSTLTALAPHVEGLLEVVGVLLRHPRPGCFARELPVSVDTKFIERHETVLRQWLDLVLPSHAIHADEDHFERRYGLRYAEPHLLVRFLDPALQREVGFPCDVLSLPLHTLETWRVDELSVLIVENKVNLLTVPRCRRALALGGLGNAVSLLRYVPWLTDVDITYWGDLDVEGFAILSSLRAKFPQVQSILMDSVAVAAWRHLAVAGNKRSTAVPPHLNDEERRAFVVCSEEDLRIEQERIPQAAVAAALAAMALTVGEASPWGVDA